MNGFLLDTNVISELMRPRPEPKVKAWVASVDEAVLFLSVLTLGEIRKGIALLPGVPKRSTLESWLQNDLRARFMGRILPVTEEIADRWGRIAAAAAPVPVPVIDGLLAATALEHDLVLVTRNVTDVDPTGVALLNPWS